ncbi:MAG: hypothetical protein H6R07_2752 [Proteobacteria bacterium]|nr:hypothetical protein [Pseudomonadota bacterium]
MNENTPSTQYRKILLKPGEAVRHWQLSSVTQQRYDVAPQPMHGEMDPFFFLTKHKNFIPHEYPCRTEFAKAHRGQHPVPMRDCQLVRWWHPFGSDRVDLSGFWFRPTRIAAWARTSIEAEEAGEARLRLSTCGGAILFVEGQQVLWSAGYQRNLEEAFEVTVNLKKGLNEIRIYFDDLAERDTRFFFQLDYLSGVPVQVALPVPVDAALAGQIEALLDDAAFDRPAYTSGEIAIVLPFAAPADLDVTTTVSGDFISLESITFNARLNEGQSRLVIATVDDIPADFRHFNITLRTGDFHASRVLGVEVYPAERQGEAPAALPDRIAEALTAVSEHSERSSVRALARLASGRAGADTDAMIEETLEAVNDCHDCADFTLVPLLWCRMRYGDAIGEEVRSKLDAAILNFRYWMDEPGNDVQWYFSENHSLLFHTAAHLAGTLFPDATFTRSGRKGSEQAEVGRQRILSWLDHFEACEMAEWNSVPYFPIDLKGLTALAGLSSDPAIRNRATAGILRLIELVARSAHQGVMTASQGRSYEHTLRAARTLELSGIVRLIWGKGGYGGRFHALPQMAILLRDHGLSIPAELADIALYQGDKALEWCYAQGANRIAKLYHYKTKHAAMGSIAAYRWNEWGYQETPLHLRLGTKPEAQVWINHPGETIQFGYGRPSYWGGCGTLPRVHQYRALAILDFDAHLDQPDFTHAWLPLSEFDEVALQDKRIGVRSGEGMAVILGSQSFVPVTTGPTRNCEVRLPGHKGRWIVRVRDHASPDGLAEFAERFSAISVQERDGDLVVSDPEYGRIVFHASGEIEAEGRRLDPGTWSIEGACQELAC